MLIDIDIKRKIGCGTTLIGFRSLTESTYFVKKTCFRKQDLDHGEYTSVEYLFFTLFWLPIFPLGCYRIYSQLNKDYFGHPGPDYVKREKPLIKEILWIYFDRLMIVPIALALFLAFILWAGKDI